MDNVPDSIYFKDRAEPLHAHQPVRGGALRRREPGARRRADRLRLLHRGARGEGAARRTGDHPDRTAAGERRGEGDPGRTATSAGCRRRSSRCAIATGKIVGTFGISRDITAAQAGRGAAASASAFYDPLTDLPNRALFLDRLQHLFHRSRRALGNPLFAVLYLDLDRFKAINDSLGHQAGDELLVSTARRLERCLRPGDTLARLGGDEFTVLLEDINCEADATGVAERIHEELAAPVEVRGYEMFTQRQRRHRAVERGLRVPRRHAARRGHGDVPGEGGRPRRPPGLRRRHAPAGGVARCASRPISGARSSAARSSPTTSRSSNLDNGAVIGFEALARWRHPSAGLLPPDLFIPVAEETGLVGADRRLDARRGLPADARHGSANIRAGRRSASASTSPARQLAHGGIAAEVERVARRDGPRPRAA